MKQVCLLGSVCALICLLPLVVPGGGELAALQLTPEATPTPADGYSYLAFASRREYNTDIYVIRPDGTGEFNLTNHPADDSWPVWSPDGTQIAFVSKRNDDQADIYLMNADGSNVRRVTNDSWRESDLAWSPDGSQLAYIIQLYHADVSGDTQPAKIFIINTDGTDFHPLIDDPPEWRTLELQPTWSPDGTQIAYTLMSWFAHKIFIRDLATGTSFPLDIEIGEDVLSESNPRWTADGESLIFCEGGAAWIVRITDIPEYNPDPNLSQGSEIDEPYDKPFDGPCSRFGVSPDGQWVARVEAVGGPSWGAEHWEIVIVSRDGSQQYQLTENNFEDYSPSWSPRLDAPIAFVGGPPYPYSTLTCPGSPFSRLLVGMQATVEGHRVAGIRPLYDEPGGEVIAELEDSTLLEITGGPLCAALFYDPEHPVRWWEVETSDGSRHGWIVESFYEQSGWDIWLRPG